MMKISIVGLGLMGGSLAYALRGFKNAELTGYDLNKGTLDAALKAGAVDKVFDDLQEAVGDADIVVLCVYPKAVMKIMQSSFKPGALVTDICGVKSALYSQLRPVLSPDINYIGIHPMAGKEVDGFENASADLYKGCGLIVTPVQVKSESSLELMHELINFIGAKNIVTADESLHDDIIAYTSDLMHISACALCMDYNKQMSRAYTAGAYRDCTRIANINAPLWTELLMMNEEFILGHLDKYIENLQTVREALASGDKESLHRLLEKAANNKKEMLKL